MLADFWTIKMESSFQIRIRIKIILVILACLSVCVTAESYDLTVHQMQQKLKVLGYDPGEPDGVWGAKTRTALMDFQSDYGLPTTGKLDALTKKKLNLIKPAENLSLHDAVRTNNTVEIEAMLSSGVNVDGRDKLGETPLHVAAVMGHKEVSTLLIEGGANVNAEDERGLTPLHAAAWMGHAEIVALLIANGADIHAKGDGGVTALHTAALAGRQNTASVLISKGADINVKNEYGLTPLHVAAIEGHRETAAMLIAQGADVHARSGNGLTAQEMASQKGNHAIVELLKKTNKQE
ncbi:MAG: ankyrin repeat domain-containing protein [Deltaproteobacteria bacterium]|jgi:ankyrin repeat protein|nr:ankyrin repeat domain-containing protein [Deltaproteobacteria bacterium]